MTFTKPSEANTIGLSAMLIHRQSVNAGFPNFALSESCEDHSPRICETEAVSKACIFFPVTRQCFDCACRHLMLDKARVNVGCQHVFNLLLRISKHQFHGREGGGGGHFNIGIHLLHHHVGKVQQLRRIGSCEGTMDLGKNLG